MKKLLAIIIFGLSLASFSQGNGIEFSPARKVSGVPPIVVTNNTVISIPQASSVTDGYLSATDWNTFNNNWKLTGNALSSNNAIFGTTTNRSIPFFTNNTIKFKFDSVGIFRMYHTTSISTINGSHWFDDTPTTGKGFSFFALDATNNENIFKFTNGVNAISGYVSTNTTVTSYGAQIGSDSNTGFGFYCNNGSLLGGFLPNGSFNLTPSTQTSGSVTCFKYTGNNNTGQTGGVEIPFWDITLNGISQASGTVPLERCVIFRTPVCRGSSATNTWSDCFTVFSQIPSNGTNGAITRKWAFGTDGQIFITDKIKIGAAGTYTAAPAANLDVTGNLLVTTTSILTGGISVGSTGGAASVGTLTLVGGSATVSTTKAVTGCFIFTQRKTSGGTIGTSSTYTVSNGVSFTLSSDNVLDTSTFNWWIVNP